LIHSLRFRGAVAYNSRFIPYIHCKSISLWMSRINSRRCTGCVVHTRCFQRYSLNAYSASRFCKSIFRGSVPIGGVSNPFISYTDMTVVFRVVRYHKEATLSNSKVILTIYSPNNLLTLLSTLSFSGSYGWSLLGISSTAGNASV